ncbi:hypothetical protein EJ110_NYTH35431 [Nymphaea thermarum]|nr:hypothetical protein EJ110_NYTH35431 [Nymphaea thermarum]
MTAMVPLYVAMLVAYGSVKWWKIFTPDQCAGINRFVALFAVPLLSFHFISTNDPYTMSLRFILADTLQKLIVLSLLAIWSNLSRRGDLEWTMTLFSVSTLPNTLVMAHGHPIAEGHVRQVLGGARIADHGAVSGHRRLHPVVQGGLVGRGVPGRGGVSADGGGGGEDGKLHVTVHKSTPSRSGSSSRRQGLSSRPSDLINAEIYSRESSQNPTPRGESFSTRVYRTPEGNSFNSAAFQKMQRDDPGTSSSSCGKSSGSPDSEPGHLPVLGSHSGYGNDQNMKEVEINSVPTKGEISEDTYRRDGFSLLNTGAPQGGERVGECQVKVEMDPNRRDSKPTSMPPARVMTRLILIMVGRKLIRNPNT